MAKRPLNPNAAKALDEMKQEIASELGLTANSNTLNPAENIFAAGPVGGIMTRKLVEMAEKQLINRNK